VYSELVFSHEALEPAPGTDNKNRACMPYPFTGQLSGDEAGNELRLLIDGFRKSALLGSGAARPQSPAGTTCIQPLVSAHVPHGSKMERRCAGAGVLEAEQVSLTVRGRGGPCCTASLKGWRARKPRRQGGPGCHARQPGQRRAIPACGCSRRSCSARVRVRAQSRSGARRARPAARPAARSGRRRTAGRRRARRAPRLSWPRSRRGPTRTSRQRC